MKYPAPLTGTNKTGTLLAHASCLINSSFFYASFAFCPGDFEPVCWAWQKLKVSETSSVLPIFSSIQVCGVWRERKEGKIEGTRLLLTIPLFQPRAQGLECSLSRRPRLNERTSRPSTDLRTVYSVVSSAYLGCNLEAGWWTGLGIIMIICFINSEWHLPCVV